MAENKKEIDLEEVEILRVSVRKKHPDATEYEYEMDVVTNDEDAVRLSEIFEAALDKEIDLPFLVKVFEKAVEEKPVIRDSSSVDTTSLLPALRVLPLKEESSLPLKYSSKI